MIPDLAGRWKTMETLHHPDKLLPSLGKLGNDDEEIRSSATWMWPPSHDEQEMGGLSRG
jgi:hypothetical protein